MRDSTRDLCGSNLPPEVIYGGQRDDGTPWEFTLCTSCAAKVPFAEPTEGEVEEAFRKWLADNDVTAESLRERLRQRAGRFGVRLDGDSSWLSLALQSRGVAAPRGRPTEHKRIPDSRLASARAVQNPAGTLWARGVVDFERLVRDPVAPLTLR